MVQTKYYDTEAEAEAMYPVYKKQVEEKRITVFKCTVQEFPCILDAFLLF